MRVLVLGATGACGSWVTRLAVQRGHAVTAVARPSSKYEAPPETQVALGQVTEPAFLEPLIESHDVAISCLGLRRASLFPWAKLMSPPDLVQQVSTIVARCQATRSLKRFIWISAGGVGDSRTQADFFIRQGIAAGNVGVAYQDLEAAEEILNDPSIPSLAVRPVTLLSGDPTEQAQPVARYGMLSSIRRSDVAQWMLNVADGSAQFDERHVLLGR